MTRYLVLYVGWTFEVIPSVWSRRTEARANPNLWTSQAQDSCTNAPASPQAVAKERRLDGAVVLPLVPFTEVAVAEVVRAREIGEEGDDAILGAALGAGLLRHGRVPDGGRGEPASKE